MNVLRNFVNTPCTLTTLSARYTIIPYNLKFETEYKGPLRSTITYEYPTSISALDVLITFIHGDLTISVANGTISLLTITGAGGQKTYTDLSGYLTRPSLCPKDNKCAVIVSFLKDMTHYGPQPLNNLVFDKCDTATCIFCKDAYLSYTCSSGATSLMIGVIWMIIVIFMVVMLTLLSIVIYKLSMKVVSCIPVIRFRKTITSNTLEMEPLKEEIDDFSHVESIHYYREGDDASPRQIDQEIAEKMNDNTDYTLSENTLTIGNEKGSFFVSFIGHFKISKGKWAVLIFLGLLMSAQGCNQFFGISGSTESCYETADNTTCEIHQSMSLTVPGVGASVCFTLSTSSGNLAAKVNIKLLDYYQLFKFGFSYYTSDYNTGFINRRDCPSSGTDNCDYWTCNLRDNCRYSPQKAGMAQCTQTVYACSWTAERGSLYGGKYIASAIGNFYSVYSLQSSYYQPIYEVTISTALGERVEMLKLSPSDFIDIDGIVISRGAESPGNMYNMERSWVTDNNNSFLCQAAAANFPTRSVVGDFQSTLPVIRYNTREYLTLGDIYYPGYDDMVYHETGYTYVIDPTGMSRKGFLCQSTDKEFIDGGFVLSQTSHAEMAARSGFSAPLTINIQTSVAYVAKFVHTDTTVRSLTAKCSGTSGIYGNVVIDVECIPNYLPFMVPMKLKYSLENNWNDLGYVNCSGGYSKINILGEYETTAAMLQANNMVIDIGCVTPFLSAVDNVSFTPASAMSQPGSGSGSWDSGFFDWFKKLPSWASNILSIGLTIVLVCVAVFLMYMLIRFLCYGARKMGNKMDSLDKSSVKAEDEESKKTLI